MGLNVGACVLNLAGAVQLCRLAALLCMCRSWLLLTMLALGMSSLVRACRRPVGTCLPSTHLAAHTRQQQQQRTSNSAAQELGTAALQPAASSSQQEAAQQRPARLRCGWVRRWPATGLRQAS